LPARKRPDQGEEAGVPHVPSRSEHHITQRSDACDAPTTGRLASKRHRSGRHGASNERARAYWTIHFRPIWAAETLCALAMDTTCGTVMTFFPLPPREHEEPLKPPQSGEKDW
jgi:hypothetical protein